MRSEKTDEMRAFWRWFETIAADLAANVEDPTLLRELDRRVRGIDEALSWEIGPGLSRSWQLVISPNLDPALRQRARDVVSAAPGLSDWEFHASRQAKVWDYQLQLGPPERSTHLDASRWTFVLLRYPDGGHEVLLRATNLPALSDDERWQAAAIALESVLGEDAVMDRVREFELLDELEPRFAEKERPIQDLRHAVLGS
jgi:hypothetical protein